MALSPFVKVTFQQGAAACAEYQLQFQTAGREEEEEKKKKTSRKTHNAIYAAWRQLCEMVASIGAQEKEKSRADQRTGSGDLKLG